MCHLRVVVFASGKGSDASSYQPDRDESQWWNRRDALVRCVAAFLFGPQAPLGLERELIILFDEDWSRFHMSIDKEMMQEDYVPSEFNIISLWKAAASEKSGKALTMHGLRCLMVHSEGFSTNMYNKRDILDYLQKECSIDFLRKHKLNSSPAVVLRKANKESLLQTYGEWRRIETSKKISSFQRDGGLSEILVTLLQPISSSVSSTVAGILHESFENELPCWNTIPFHDSQMQLCLFLGAVRDMSHAETRNLERLCKESGVPVVRIRLGPVAEFTSKILTIIATHHSEGVLGPAITRVIETPTTLKRKREEENILCAKANAELYTICLVPFSSGNVSTDLKDRDEIIWNLVRCTVTSLWRSRMVGHPDTKDVSNTLILGFSDGLWISLGRKDLVEALAEQHQAAPSEHQVLAAIMDRIRSRVDSMGKRSWKVVTNDILSWVLPKSDRPAYLLIHSESHRPLMELFYKHEITTKDRDICVLYLVRLSQSSPEIDIAFQSIMKKAKKRNVRLVEATCVSSKGFRDAIGASITLLQHFVYQNRLENMLQEAVLAK